MQIAAQVTEVETGEKLKRQHQALFAGASEINTGESDHQRMPAWQQDRSELEIGSGHRLKRRLSSGEQVDLIAERMRPLNSRFEGRFRINETLQTRRGALLAQ